MPRKAAVPALPTMAERLDQDSGPNQLDDSFSASAAEVVGKLLLRSERSLCCNSENCLARRLLDRELVRIREREEGNRIGGIKGHEDQV